MTRFLVLLDGDPPPDEARPLLDTSTVVAADGAARFLHAWDHAPDVLVGDLDAIPEGTLAWCRGMDVEVVRHPAAKRDVDGWLALELARDRGAQEVVVTGVEGGRVDMVLANLGLLARLAADGVRVTALGSTARTWIATPTHPVTLEDAVGATVSVLALGGEARGVHLTGFRWSLEDATMHPRDPYGTSNLVTDPVAEVTVGEGVLAVLQVRDSAL